MPDPSVLDNLAWHALDGPHRSFAEHTGSAAKYLPEFSIFAGSEFAASTGAPAWDDLARLAGPGGVVALFRRSVGAIPDDFEVMFASQAHQMIAIDPLDADRMVCRSDFGDSTGRLGAVEVLDDGDAADMLTLARLTEPGPFFARTHQLGRFVGVRDDAGRLVAMAGERFRAGGWVEISGVCTHPDVRGKGLAAALTLDVARAIHASGTAAVLHVKDGNDVALRLYRRLGFIERCMIDIVAVRCPS